MSDGTPLEIQTGGPMAAAQRSGTTATPTGATTMDFGTLVTEELLQVAHSTRVIIPKGTWQSYGSEEEIRQEQKRDQGPGAMHSTAEGEASYGAPPIPRRAPLSVQFEVPRSVVLRHRLLLHGTFITKEASEDSRDLRSTANALYDVTRDEVDVGVQAVPVRVAATTQTHYARKVNAASQAQSTLVDACISHAPPPAKEQPALSAFLQRALPRTLHCLTQNVEVPIYADDFARFNDDDTVTGGRDEMVLFEKGNYVHSSTKGRKISTVTWRSSRKRDDCIAVASVGLWTLTERVAIQRQCACSVSLVWELNDPMHPKYVLESPDEVQVLRFHPTRPNIIAGGAINGQVYLWDLSLADAAKATMAATQAVMSAPGAEEPQFTSVSANAAAAAFAEICDVPEMPNSVEGVSIETEGGVQVPRLQPIQISRVEASHRGPVHDLQWMSNTLECTFEGKQTTVAQTHQFCTAGDDGAMLVWDIRPDFLPQDKLRKIRHQSRGGTTRDEPWVPLQRYVLTRPDGAGDIPAFRFFVNGPTPDGSPSYSVAVGSTDGELGFCEMVTQHERRASLIIPTFGLTKETRFVRSVVPFAHAGPIYCTERHPSIGDIYLTCGDNCFKVWRSGLSMPLFESPRSSGTVTCAAWSPGRPGVVFTGTSDGKLEVWDLLERNSEPLLSHHMVQDAITSIAFKPLPASPVSGYAQQIVVGTNLGSFHWYVLPPTLSMAPRGERRTLRRMLEREVRRVAYYQWRWQEREWEIDRFGYYAAAARASGGTRLEAGKPSETKAKAEGKNGKQDALKASKDADENDEDNPYNEDTNRDAEFLELIDKLHQQELEVMRAEAIG